MNMVVVDMLNKLMDRTDSALFYSNLKGDNKCFLHGKLTVVDNFPYTKKKGKKRENPQNN